MGKGRSKWKKGKIRERKTNENKFVTESEMVQNESNARRVSLFLNF